MIVIKLAHASSAHHWQLLLAHDVGHSAIWFPYVDQQLSSGMLLGAFCFPDGLANQDE